MAKIYTLSEYTGEHSDFESRISEELEKPSIFINYEFRNFTIKTLENFKKQQQAIANKVVKTLENKIPKAEHKKIIIYDSTDLSREGGGGGLILPETLFWMRVGLVFAIFHTSSGFFTKLGEDIYELIKEKLKKYFGNQSILIEINRRNRSRSFLIHGYFNKKTFIKAWESLFRSEAKKPPRVKNEQLNVFDPKSGKWEEEGGRV